MKKSKLSPPAAGKAGTFTFKTPVAVVEASRGNCAHLAFSSEHQVSDKKVRRYGADQNPERLGKSVVVTIGGRSVRGCVDTTHEITNPQDCKEAMRAVAEHMDEMGEHELIPTVNFGAYQGEAGDPVVKIFVACGKCSTKVKGSLYAVTDSGKVALTALFSAERRGPVMESISAGTNQPPTAVMAGA